MNRSILLVAAVVAAIFLSGAQFTRAEDAKSPAKVPPYAPGLGDFMTAYVQPHHIKLWLAGNAQNWPLADYEAKELRETFEDIGTYQAVWHDFPIARMVESILIPTLADVDDAIKRHDQARFKTAFERTTAACNTCHMATNNGFLVIRVPSGSAFEDQQFQAK